MMTKIVKTLLVLALLVSNSGCSVFMAARQPDKKDVGIFTEGTRRSLIIAEYGHPTTTDESESGRVDVFKFTQGYSKGTKATRAVTHGAMDVMTFGLWEVIATPAESIADGTEMAVEVHYDQQDVVTQIIPLTEKTKVGS